MTRPHHQPRLCLSVRKEETILMWVRIARCLFSPLSPHSTSHQPQPVTFTSLNSICSRRVRGDTGGRQQQPGPATICICFAGVSLGRLITPAEKHRGHHHWSSSTEQLTNICDKSHFNLAHISTHFCSFHWLVSRAKQGEWGGGNIIEDVNYIQFSKQHCTGGRQQRRGQVSARSEQPAAGGTTLGSFTRICNQPDKIYGNTVTFLSSNFI